MNALNAMKRETRRKVIAEQLSTVTTTLCKQCWSGEVVDRQLLAALSAALSTLDACGLVTRFIRERVTLSYVLPGSDVTGADLSRLISHLDEQQIGSINPTLSFDLSFEHFWVIGCPIVESTLSIAGGGEAVLGYSALFFRDVGELAEEVRAQLFSLHGKATVGLLFQLLQHRVRLFMPFPAQVAERYWSDATGGRDRPLLPPWEAETPLLTVTLSFDLRKSTFCMEASDPQPFADWLDDLVQILTRVAHMHGGVFDKFTGDGGLVHFLELESQAVYREPAIVAALDCAIALQKATAMHLRRLRRFLRLNSTLLGGAVGIDVANATWSLDHRYNPITVGRGVVYACRVGDKAPADAIRLTNIAYQELTDSVRATHLFREVEFESKEFTKEMGITVWELQRVSSVSFGGTSEVERICQEVYTEADQRRERRRARRLHTSN